MPITKQGASRQDIVKIRKMHARGSSVASISRAVSVVSEVVERFLEPEKKPKKKAAGKASADE